MDFSQFSVLLTQTNTEGQYLLQTNEAASNQPAANETSQGGQGTTTQPPAAGAAPTVGAASLLPTLLIYVVAIGGFMYFMNRNQKKKDKLRQERQNSLKIGDNICTTTGFYGKIVDVEERTFIIEFGTNKGVRIPVRKSEVYPAKETDETASTPSNG